MRCGLGMNILGLCALVVVLESAATAATAYYNDMWWNPRESGWGVNIAQRGSTLFMTFFVYADDSKPAWVTGLLTQTGHGPTGQPVFTGDIYVTSGPYYGAPFNTSAVNIRKAGTVSFSPSDAVSGNLGYMIDGVSVTKSIQRQTLVNDDVSGNYAGTSHVLYNCPPDNVFAMTSTRHGSITHSGTQFRYQETTDAGSVCTWEGAWSQEGVLGRVNGTLSCTDGSAGTFSMSDIASSELSLSGRVSATGVFNLPPMASCTAVGTFALLR
jgi:hypothetical protein